MHAKKKGFKMRAQRANAKSDGAMHAKKKRLKMREKRANAKSDLRSPSKNRALHHTGPIFGCKSTYYAGNDKLKNDTR